MAADGNQIGAFNELLDRYERQLLDSFLRAIEDLKTEAEVQKVIRLLEAGDINGAIVALHLDEAAFNPLVSAIAQAYEAGGQHGAWSLPKRSPSGDRLAIRFDGLNPRAQQWLRDHSTQLVTRILEDQRQAIRGELLGGLQRGENPRVTTLNIVGRINRATGRRDGGIIGLTSAQAAAVQKARGELGSTDPADLQRYLGRGRRDKRFDRTVAKAMREGGKVPLEIAQRAGDRYADRLLQLRGEMLARTEALTSLHAGQYQALLQSVDNGAVRADQLRRTWRSAGDGRVRHTHRGLNGDSVGLTEAFTSPSGARMRFPGDTSLGAPGDEVIGCRCVVTARVDWLSNLLGRAA